MSTEAVGASRAARDAFAARAQARAGRRVVRNVATALLFMGAIFWGVYLVITIAVPLIVHAAGGVMGGGVMTGAEYSARWFALSVGVGIFAGTVGTHLAAGGTRRALWGGSVRASLLGSVAFGLLFSVGMLVEHGLFGLLGWTTELRLGSMLGPEDAWFAVSAVAEAVVIVTYVVVGMAISAGFYSHSPWVGILFVPVGLVLCLLVEGATRTGAGDDILTALLGPGALPGSVVVGVPAGLLVLCVAGAWYWWQVRSIRLRPAR